MKSKFGVLLLLLIVVWLVRCGDAPPQRPENPIPTAPTPAPPPPPPLPLIAGTWNGTLTFLSSADGRKCPVSMEIEQPGAGQEVSGSIRAEECFFARFEAQLVRQGPIWVISGRAHFSLISDDYCSYQASLNGHMEGSPDSRLIASTTGFRCATQPDRSGIGLELTRSAR